ncbi:MAG: ABC transporter ATP-binding protein [Candidatus Hodarchaeota archaeon]
MSLKTNNIVAGYGNVEILHGVSIYVENKKIVCVIGPNGAGKSTLLKVIFGFIRPKHGSVIFNGEDITGSDPIICLRKGISYLFQGQNVFPSLTVLENLDMGAYSRHDNKAEIERDREEILDQFPILKKRKNQKAGTLSGGEQRMLEIARSLMVHPKLIILDEPSIGLEPKFSKKIYEAIKQTNEKGITFLIVEQNVRKILRNSDFCYLLDLGRVRTSGSSREMLESEEVVKTYLPS